VSAEDPTLPGTNDGVIGTASVTTDNKLNPTNATVTCSIKVNSTLAPVTTNSFSGNGAQADAAIVTYQAGSFDSVELRETVTYADGTTNPDVCNGVVSNVIPPQDVWELVQSILGALDPTVCPIFSSLAGTYGPLEIDSTGDILNRGQHSGLGLQGLRLPGVRRLDRTSEGRHSDHVTPVS
jgi:hypothetical protein